MWIGIISILSLLSGNLTGALHYRFETEKLCIEHVVTDVQHLQQGIDESPYKGEIKLIGRCVKTIPEDSL